MESLKISKNKNGEFSYNPEAPIYSAKYQLQNDDYNVRQLRKNMTFQQKKRLSYF